MMVRIKGHEIHLQPIKDSFDRRAQQFKNKIITTLSKLGITEDDIEIDLEPAAKKATATATWYFQNHRMHYSCKTSKYVDNLQLVYKVIELEVNAVLKNEKPIEDFIREFSESKDVEESRKKAREILGVEENSLDIDKIDVKYKELAKKYHPDMPEGNAEKFKEINHAHKILKRELR